MTSNTALIATLGGVLPALAWLLFWLREDSKRPEPKGLILKTFIFGMASVIMVIPFQKAFGLALGERLAISFIVWAILEEVFKFVAAYFGGLKSKEAEEPLDAVIYLITAALGFTAMENILFIRNPLLEADIILGIATGSMRFLGASLVHIASSGIVGIAIAGAFYKAKKIRALWTIAGLVAGSALHATFNLFILSSHPYGTLMAFIGIWFSIPIIFLFIERIKSLRRRIKDI